MKHHSSWILRAFLLDRVKRNPTAAVEWYTKAIEFLEHGREIWNDVPSNDRGTIFEESILRGAKALRLEPYMEVRCSANILRCEAPLHIFLHHVNKS